MTGFDYEKALARLEDISRQMSDEATSLDLSVELYKEAAELISQITKRLAEAKLEIEKASSLAEKTDEL